MLTNDKKGIKMEMESKVHNLPIRLTGQQFAAIEAAAASCEMKVSTWMRELSLGVAGARQIDTDIARGKKVFEREAKNETSKKENYTEEASDEESDFNEDESGFNEDESDFDGDESDFDGEPAI